MADLCYLLEQSVRDLCRRVVGIDQHGKARQVNFWHAHYLLFERLTKDE
jgi:hypothetical protein